MFARRLLGCLLCSIAVFIVGCGERRPLLVSATGKVMFDGKPVTAGAIIFHPHESNSYVKDSPSSLLQVDGSFTMKTFPFGEGVSPGEYTVTLAPELATRLGKPQYASLESSPWEISISEAGLKDHVFEVTTR